jgi:hypothetical protein
LRRFVWGAAQLATVMLLPFDQVCGSRLNYKLVHASIRIACLVGIAVVLVIALVHHRFNPVLEQLTVVAFFGLPVAVLSTAVFESVWFGRTKLDIPALAIDWFFVLAFLLVWAYEMLYLLMMPVFL